MDPNFGGIACLGLYGSGMPHQLHLWCLIDVVVCLLNLKFVITEDGRFVLLLSNAEDEICDLLGRAYS